MEINITAWHVISFVAMLCGSYFGMGKMLFNQFKKTVEDRDDNLAKSLTKIDDRLVKESEEIRRIDRQILELKAELPEKYVTKNDFVRSFTVVEHKLDALGTKLELANIKVAMNKVKQDD